MPRPARRRSTPIITRGNVKMQQMDVEVIASEPSELTRLARQLDAPVKRYDTCGALADG